MALFGLFGSKEERDQKRVKELAKKAQEIYGDPASRTKALESLRELGTPEAISGLLSRFTVKVEPGITDAEEKDYVFGMVTSFGDTAVEPVREFIRRNNLVSWGLRCLDVLVPEDEVVATTVSVLDRLAREYSRDPEKKVVLINHLANHKDPRVTPAVLPFLEDQSDDVRLAAMATLVKQGDPACREPIVQRLVGDEAVRVRAAAAAALADLGFGVQGYREKAEAMLPEGFSLDREGVVKRRG